MLDVVLTESKSSIERRWVDAQVFASLPRSGTCVPCRNEELLVASVDFEVATHIPNVSVSSLASHFRNNSDVRWSFNMLQTVFADETLMLGNLTS